MTSSLRSIDPQINKANGDLKAIQFPVSNFPLHLVTPQGQLQIHTASYRGSFSKVLSEALRTAGLGSNVLIAQFLKGGVNQGTENGINLCGSLNWIRPDLPYCLTNDGESSSLEEEPNPHKAIKNIWIYCKEQLEKKTIDRLVLDEIGLACAFGYIDKNDLITTLANRPTATDIILTGPSISSEIIAMADQVTQLR